MPNLNVKGESSRPSAAPAGGGGGGASKTILIIVVAIVAVGAVLFVLNSTGVVKLWGKKKAQPQQVMIPSESLPPVTEETTMVQPELIPQDTTPVEENITKLESNAKVTPGEAPRKMVVTGTGMYTVQISSWPVEEKASAQAQLFSDAGYEAFVEPMGGWYRVCIGRYESKADAKAQVQKMEHMLESMPVIAKVGK